MLATVYEKFLLTKTVKKNHEDFFSSALCIMYMSLACCFILV